MKRVIDYQKDYQEMSTRVPQVLFFIMFFYLFWIGNLGIGMCATYYVEPKGSSALDDTDQGVAAWANAASISSPTSAQTAMNRAQAGDVVNFRGGTYITSHDYDSYHAHYEPANSGSSGNKIAFQAYQDETPVMNCVVGGAYEGCASLGNGDKDHIVFDGFTVTTDSGERFGSIMITGFNRGYKVVGCEVRNNIFEGGTTSLNATDNRETLRIEVTSDTVVENNIFKDLVSSIGNHNTSFIKTYINDNLTIQNNEFYNGQLGIYLKRDTEGATLINNYIHDVEEAIYISANSGSHSGNISIVNNLIHDCGHGSISSTPADGETIDSLIVANNTIYNTSKGIGFGKTASGKGAKIYNNIIYGSHSKIVSNGDDAELEEADHNNYCGYVYNVMNLYGGGQASYSTLTSWLASGELDGGSNPGLGSLSTDPSFANISGSMSELVDFAVVNSLGRSFALMGANVSVVGTGRVILAPATILAPPSRVYLVE